MDPIELPADTAEQRITKALAIAVAYGSIDGAHHKDWTIDQMVRALTGCPVGLNPGSPGQPSAREHVAQLESQEYKELVAEVCNGDAEGWPTGIAP